MLPVPGRATRVVDQQLRRGTLIGPGEEGLSEPILEPAAG